MEVKRFPVWFFVKNDRLMLIEESSFGSNKYPLTRVFLHFDLYDRLSARKDSSMMIQNDHSDCVTSPKGGRRFPLEIHQNGAILASSFLISHSGL
jgi:hypothetical protein